MSLFSRGARSSQKRELNALAEVFHTRYSGSGSVPVTNESAMRHSAVWACLRLRANLISTMPIDCYRDVAGVSVEVPKPTVLVNPGGERVNDQEWRYSTQVDLDRAGNCFGLITERYGTGLPARIDLQPIQTSSVIMRDGKLRYKFAGKEYDPADVWHEKQYTIAGLPFGLSALAAASWTIGEYLSVQEFATKWFGTGGMPKAHLRNSGKVLRGGRTEAQQIKDMFKESVQDGDIWVTGSDWEYKPLNTVQAGNSWIESRQLSISDVARYFDCPGDLIDAAVHGSSVTYANIVQRNLQFLIMSLGPAISRRERSLSDGLLSKPRYLKFNTSALLRMDDKTRADMFKVRIDSRTITPNEVRAIEDEKPLTPAQIEEFNTFWPPKSSNSAETNNSNSASPEGANNDG